LFAVVAGHVYCTRHVHDNVSRHLTDKGVDASCRQQVIALLKRCTEVSADNTAGFDDALHSLLEYVRVNVPQHVEYFERHVLPKLRNNIKVFA